MSNDILRTLYFLKQNLNHSRHNTRKYEQQQQTRDSRSSFPITTLRPEPPLEPPLKQTHLDVFAYSHTMVSSW